LWAPRAVLPLIWRSFFNYICCIKSNVGDPDPEFQVNLDTDPVPNPDPIKNTS
jgi:hypothetical protein